MNAELEAAHAGPSLATITAAAAEAGNLSLARQTAEDKAEQAIQRAQQARGRHLEALVRLANLKGAVEQAT